MNLESPSPSPSSSPAGRLVFGNQIDYATLSRLRASSRAVKLATGLNVVDAALPPETLVKHHLWEIVAHYWPGAVVSDRSALAGGPDQGWLFLCHPEPPRGAKLVLPGVTVTCRVGPGRLPGDMPWPHDLFMSGVARGLIENVTALGRPPEGRPHRAAGPEAVGDRIDELARSSGAGRVQNALAELDATAGHFDPTAVESVRKLLAAVLGTVSGGRVASPLLAARLAGEPYDAQRVSLFQGVSDTLQNTAPSTRPALGDPARWTWLPFFEAYFSNYIEGTIFSIDEARDIALHDKVPTGRPADAHDISATYRLVSDPKVMTTLASTADDFIELMQARHRVLLAGRPEKRPGELKEEANFAGGYEFVHRDHLRGTLRAGYDLIAQHTDPFHRAALTMFVVTECHPFDDGNGRTARLMANVELVAGGQMRIVIPNAYRGNYLAALAGTSNGAGSGESLISVLDFTRRWVGAVDWSDWDAAVRDLESTNALLDSDVAEQSGQRLRLPLRDN